jgi:hypothetical protein
MLCMLACTQNLYVVPADCSWLSLRTQTDTVACQTCLGPLSYEFGHRVAYYLCLRPYAAGQLLGSRRGDYLCKNICACLLMALNRAPSCLLLQSFYFGCCVGACSRCISVVIV